MKTVGIICEYNPIHDGHVLHIAETRRVIGSDTAVVCVMSGNFVQRGDFAVFSKHARAEAAILCGADLVIELPSPYALASAERFARAGVSLLGATGICDYLSFGSESGDIEALSRVAAALDSRRAADVTAEHLSRGLPYASARQKAAESVLNSGADMLKSPNNLLGIEYLRALSALGSDIRPITVRRLGAGHDAASGCSSSALRSILRRGGDLSSHMPRAALEVYTRETDAGRAPVFADALETAMLARLRALPDSAFNALPDASEGLGDRLKRFARSEPSVGLILEKTKTKRYAMSRIRRMLICAVLGITTGDTCVPPPYIRALAMNGVGRQLIRGMRTSAALPVITKPAFAKALDPAAAALFIKEAAATDFYVLAFHGAENRIGGREWTQSPRVLRDG